MWKSIWTILTFLLFANSIFYVFSTMICVTFEDQKEKRISRMAAELLVKVSLTLYSSLLNEETMCYYTYMKAVLVLSRFVCWVVIYFMV